MSTALKQQFKNYIHIDPMVKYLEEKIDKAYQMASATVISPSGNGHTLTVHGYEDIGDGIIGVSELCAERASLLRQKAYIEKLVSEVEDLRTQQVLTLRYLEGRRWRDVAAKIGPMVSEDNAKKIVQKYFRNRP